VDKDARFAAQIPTLVKHRVDAHDLRQLAGVVDHLLDVLVEAQLGDTDGSVGVDGHGDGRG
jgi:hypothetical protein